MKKNSPGSGKDAANNKKKDNAAEADTSAGNSKDPDSIDLPDVKDIPGQEHIRPPKLKEFRDTTISSSDEEGDDIFDEEELLDEDSNITPEELELLDEAGDSDTDDERLRRGGRLDEVDDDGDPLNEESDLGGDDLDVPGAEEDDADEAIGEEDEANNPYSVDKENEEEDPNANSNI